MQINKKQKLVLRLIGLVAITTMILPSIVKAQEYTEVNVTLQVDQGQLADITVDGCWKQVLGNWQWSGSSDATLTLLQPGDREDTGSGDPADGTDSDWGIVTGTAKYDTAGGNPNFDEFAPTNTNAFAYGDCKFTLSFMGYDPYAIELYGTPFDHTVVVEQIDDMRRYNQTDFDYLLNAGNSGYPYVANQGEHGFYILAENIGNVETDDGTAAGVAYDTDRTYTDTTCNTDRPCYHFIPTGPTSQDLYTFTNAGDFENKTLIIRTAAGADFSFPAGDYAMTLTINLNTTP